MSSEQTYVCSDFCTQFYTIDIVMTDREQEILEIIRDNPLISQKELARKLGISRSAAAGHIMNLSRKGHIQGKGYILREKEYAVVMGGANMDIQGFPGGPLVPRDSNPGEVKVSCGGVARNIAENLARLGVDVKLLTVLGDDPQGDQLIQATGNAGVDTKHILTIPGERTSSYLSILDDQGDMALAVSGMTIMEKFVPEYIRSKDRIIRNASLIILDANLPDLVIEYIGRTYPDIPIFADPVSSSKAKRLGDLLPVIHTIKPNELEAAILAGRSLSEKIPLEETAGLLLKKGVSEVIISLKERGIYYLSREKEIRLPNPRPLPGSPVNATGCGDAFLAGLAYSYLKGDPPEVRLKKALAASLFTLCHEDTINPHLSADKIEEYLLEGSYHE